MDCVSEAQVLGFLLHTLDPEERALVELHLDRCAECLEVVTLASKSSLAARSIGTDDTLAAPPGCDDNEVALAPGTWIGRYEVEEPLGRGGMGMVYTARDSQLGRRVALKLVTPHLARNPGSQLALLREAQAMARITQPNVLTVYDSGTFGDAVFLVAERVDGDTLEAWLARPRRWRVILEVFLQAARGLEAAHDAGLVHRDFKPTNVLVGRDGRVRVFDFGVVRLADTSAPGRELAGTPLYMSPEQRRGDVADARSDQYAFCVTLHEALFGRLPGRAARERTTAGTIDRVPGWLRELVARGLQPDPDQRYPTTRAMIDAFEDRLRRRRHRAIAGIAGVAVAVAVTTAVVGYLRGVNAPLARCPEPALAAWTPQARARLGAKITATGLVFAPAAWTSAERVLDDYAARWRSHHRASCLAFEVHATESAPLHQRRNSCLERDRIVLEAIVDRIDVADRALVAQLPQLLDSLPDLDACTNAESPAWPDESGARDRLAEHYRAVARISSLADAGRFADAARELAPVVAGAAVLGFPAAEADAEYLAGRIASLRGDYTEAARLLEAARWRAEGARYDELVVNASSELLTVIGTLQRKSSDIRQLINHASAAAERIGSPAARLRAAQAIGTAEASAGNYVAAEAQLEKARKLVESRDPPDRAVLAAVLDDLGYLAMRRRRYPEAEQLRRRAIELTIAELGPEHPQHAYLKSNLATTLSSLNRLDEARTMFEEALALRERGLGPEHAALAPMLDAFGHLCLRTGEIDRARALFERSLAIADKAFPTGHPMHTTALVSLANVRRLQGDSIGAERLFRRVFDIRRAELGLPHHATIEVAFDIANLALRRGDHATARMMCESLMADEVTDMWTRASTISCLGEAELVAGQRDAALPTLAKALTMYPPDGDPYGAAWTRFLIASALPATERRRALELARAARSLIARESSLFKYEVERIDAWLAQPGHH